MSYFSNVNIKSQDSPSIDSFGRWRTSELTTLLDIKQLHDGLPLLIDTITNGTATSVHSTTDSNTTISTNADGDYVVAQTFQRMNYQSGKSQLIFQTFSNFGIQTNVSKKIGYFSSSTTAPYASSYDGVWLENNGTTFTLKTYRSGVETNSAAQSTWDDPLDGTGSSGITIDWNKGNIFAYDFEWLGKGRVRFFMVIDGLFVKFHEFNNANILGEVYMSSPNQPLRWEIRQTGVGGGVFKYVCGSVNSEGSTNLIGKDSGIDDDGVFLDANSIQDWYYAIGVRLKADRTDTVVQIISGYLLSNTNDKFLYRILLNPTYAGTVTYVDVTNYSISYGLGATANTISDQGTILSVGSGDSNSVQSFDLDTAIRLGSSINGTLDEIVIAVKPLTTNLDIHRGINWKELT